MGVSMVFALVAGYLNWWLSNWQGLQHLPVAIRMGISGTVFVVVFLGGLLGLYGKESIRELFRKEKKSQGAVGEIGLVGE